MKHKPFEHMKEITCFTDKSKWYWCDEYRAEIDRLTAQLAERDAEIERFKRELIVATVDAEQAHRQGWEQCQREMAQEVDMEGGIKYKPGSWEQQALYKAANRIRAMEYKGAEKTV